MPTARSYDRYSLDGEPFKENGRMYVYVMMPSGNKKVRWYTEAERAAQDRKAGIEPKVTDMMMTFNARHAFGFDDAGYITLYRGEEHVIEDWAHAQWPPRAWRNLTFGFYTPSKIDVGELPEGITPIKLSWDEVKQDDIHMKSHDEVKRYVDVLIGPGATSNDQWAINDWVEKKVVVKEKKTNQSHFGEKHTYTLDDAQNHTFVWTTGAKDYQVGMVVKLKMKVKEYKNNTIIVWYCKEV